MTSYSDTVFLFGDHNGSVLESLRSSRAIANNSTIGLLFHRCMNRLQKRIFESSLAMYDAVRSQCPVELALASKGDMSATGTAVNTALLCLSQFADVIRHLEASPGALERGPESRILLLGISTGLLTAAAISCCKSLEDVLRVADGIVEVAFNLGLEAAKRSAYLEALPSASDQAYTWSTCMSGVNVEEVRNAINAQVDHGHTRAYASVIGPFSITISGPPSTMGTFFRNHDFTGSFEILRLPVNAAFHADHLCPVSSKQMMRNASSSLFGMKIQHTFLISSNSGHLIRGETLGELLPLVLQDVLQFPVVVNDIAEQLDKILGSKPSFVSFGSRSIMDTIDQVLHVHQQKRVNEPQQDMGLNAWLDADSNSAASTKLAPLANPDDIAIIGMGFRLPGSETPEELWSVLEKGLDLHQRVPADRFDLSTHYDPDGITSNTSRTPYGVFIQHPGRFDRHLFHMSPREALQTDPQQRLLLLAIYEALEMAGYSPDRTGGASSGLRVGSFIGQTGDDWREVNSSQEIDTYYIPGGMRAFGPGKLHYHFGWEGPSYSIDTACSSSASAIQLASSALLARECDMAISGGVNFLTAPDIYAGLSRGGFLSATGGCKTFDDDADGYCRADAVGVVILKRLSDAIRERDAILAVVRGVMTNHSAEAISITHPHAGTQERLFTALLSRSNLEPGDIKYVEMHGTGTQAGDACEMTSVINSLARDSRTASNPLHVGSIKPSIGHGEGGSGVASLIKAILMLRKNTIPPHSGIKGRINRNFPNLEDIHIRIANSNTALPPHDNTHAPRRILINNFDAAGGNTSMIIEDPPDLILSGSDSRSYHAITVSGKTKNSAINNAKRLLSYVKEHPRTRLEDVAYSTTARRAYHHAYRLAFVASSLSQLCRDLEQTIAKDDSITDLAYHGGANPPNVIFVFTGQGCQYVAMASGLYEMFPQFRDSLDSMAKICVSYSFTSFMPLITSPAFDISKASPVQLHTCIVAIELALVSLWKDHGVTPDAVIGHSLGELPALCTAGVISITTCLYLTGQRASLLAESCTPGTHAMLIVNQDEEFVNRYLTSTSKHWIEAPNYDGDLTRSEDTCEIACLNSPQSTVISGSLRSIDILKHKLHDAGAKVSILDIPFAFHSSQMNAILDDYETEANCINYTVPQIPVASTKSGELISEYGVINGAYLRQQTRNPVQFHKAVHSLMKMSSFANSRGRIWLEVGPSPTCLGLISTIIANMRSNSNDIMIPSIRKGEEDCKSFAHALASAYKAGVRVNWAAHHKPYEQALRLLELPSYAFDLQNYWIQYEGDWSRQKGRNVINSSHQYTQASSLYRLHQSSTDNHQISVILVADLSDHRLKKIIRGHRVNGIDLCPSSLYAEMAFSAALYLQDLHGPALSDNTKSALCMDVRDMEVNRPLVLEESTQQLVFMTAHQAKASETIWVQFSSRLDTSTVMHAKCQVVFGDGHSWRSGWNQVSDLVRDRIDLLTSLSPPRPTQKVLRPMAYKLFAALVDYDEQFHGMEEIHFDSEMLEATAKVRFRTQADSYFHHHPCWIDSLAHISGFVLNGTETTPSDTVYISHGWKSIKIAVPTLSPQRVYNSYVRMKEDQQIRGTMIGDVYILEERNVIALVQEIRFRRVKRSQLEDLFSFSSSKRNSEKLIALSEEGPEMSVSVTQSEIVCASSQTVSKMEKSHAIDDQRSMSDIDLIFNIIAEEAGIERSSLTDDHLLADSGIDSLLSLTIAARVKDILGWKLPSSLILGSMYMSDLRSNLIRHLGLSDPGSERAITFTPTTITDFDAPTNSNIVSIEATVHLLRSPDRGRISCGPERILFLLPDGSGSARSYMQFAAEGLGADGLDTIYGLNSPFVNNTDMAAWNAVAIGDIVSSFVRAIRAVQPQGPYHIGGWSIGGWSIGGIYAFEVAALLQNVSNMLLIDPPRVQSSIDNVTHSAGYRCETASELIDIASFVRSRHQETLSSPQKLGTGDVDMGYARGLGDFERIRTIRIYLVRKY
ncbi:ketoacyl-synt-domain-containing protein [Nemania sp. FL0916]|nr:ketoacyl-synt-domain-containing protein [Nemania sp. FL0916]